MTRTTRTAPALCPHCGYAVDAASAMDRKSRPRPGDWSLCLSCAGLSVFDDLLRPVLPGFGVLSALRLEDPAQYEEIERARAAIRIQRAARPIPRQGGEA